MPPKKPTAAAKPAPAAAAPTPYLTRSEITHLLDAIHEKGIEEFELEQGGFRLRVVASRGPAPIVHSQPMMHYPMPMVAASASAPAAHAPAPAPSSPEVPATSSTAKTPVEDDAKCIKITSPMVGTFYRSPSPGAKAFVEVGDRVDENSVLCIIEAMKLMNEIKAECRGTVKKICVDNAQPVEYGQVLYLIDPA